MRRTRVWAAGFAPTGRRAHPWSATVRESSHERPGAGGTRWARTVARVSLRSRCAAVPGPLVSRSPAPSSRWLFARAHRRFPWRPTSFQTVAAFEAAGPRTRLVVVVMIPHPQTMRARSSSPIKWGRDRHHHHHRHGRHPAEIARRWSQAWVERGPARRVEEAGGAGIAPAARWERRPCLPASCRT